MFSLLRAHVGNLGSRCVPSNAVRCYVTPSRVALNIPDPMWEGKEIMTKDTKHENGYCQAERRCGVLATKIGMTADWDKWGRRIPLTALQIQDCVVTQRKTPETDGLWGLIVGAKNASKSKKRYMPNANVKMYENLGMGVKTALSQFNVTENSMLPVGTPLTVRHFRPGQYIDCRGVTRGKGFAGVMKRHGFKGGPATHGCTKAHRRMGGAGGATNPGRTFKGKLMPGNMGNDTRWQWSLWLYKMNTVHNILFVKGCVPGAKGSTIKITDARRKVFKMWDPLPFPTHFPVEGEDVPETLVAPLSDDDPHAYE